jgi:glycine C-acetyltransferase
MASLDIKKASMLRFMDSESNDIFAKGDGFFEYITGLKMERIYGYRVNTLTRDGCKSFVDVEGERKWVIDCATNDYLGMNMNPAVIQAVRSATEEYGIGSQGAAMLNGNTPIHFELERELADFLGMEDATISSSGYGSQIAAMQGLLRPSDASFYDRLCHASLLDGMRISGAATYKYPHLDLDALEKLLKDYRSKHHGALIVTDGVFSAEGTVADVASLMELGRAYNARVLVDDAHGLGTLNGGRGTTYPVRPDIVTGTLSKALSAAGGFIAGPRKVIKYLRLFGSANCATTNLTVANAAASLASLRLLKAHPEMTDKLHHNVEFLRRKLAEKGVETANSASTIFAVVCGDDFDAYRAWRKLFDRGVLTHPLPFPIVPFGQSRIRLRMNANLTDEALENVAEAVAELWHTLPKKSQVNRVRIAPMVEQGFEQKKVETPAGGMMAYLKGSGETVVFLHSLLFGPEIYNGVYRALGTSVGSVALEFHGHGSSDPANAPITIDDLSAYTWDAMKNLGITESPVTLVGTSLGGMVALRIAAAHPDQVANLLLIGSSADEEESTSKRLFESLAKVADSLGTHTIMEDLMMSMFSSYYINNHPLSSKDWEEYILRRSPMDYLPCVQAVLQRQEAVDLLAKIRTRTVVMVGEEDVAEPTPHSVVLHKKIAASTLEIISDCGHLVPIEKPNEVVKVLKGWLGAATK